MSKPKQIADLIAESIGPTDGPRLVVDVIKQIAIAEKFSEPGFEEDFAEGIRARVSVHLRQHDDKHSDGFYTPFMLFGLDDEYIAGRYRPLPDDEPTVASDKKRRAQIASVLRAVNDFTPDEFEKLCQKLPELMEGERQAYKPPSNDQGIDFFSRVRFGALISEGVIGIGRERQLNAWIVGQAKHYKKTVVGTKEIRELIGAIDLARAKIFSGNDDPLKYLEMKLCEPVFYCFFSSGRFTDGSKKLMSRSGIIFLEGFDIAQFLADKNAGFDNDDFDECSFRSWVGV